MSTSPICAVCPNRDRTLGWLSVDRRERMLLTMLNSSLRSSLARLKGCSLHRRDFNLLFDSSLSLRDRHTAASMASLAVLPPERLKKPLAVPSRLLFGPGPSNCPPRILEAGAKPVIGHMHPEIFEVSSVRRFCKISNIIFYIN